MTFDEVLRDMFERAIEEAKTEFAAQRERHEFKAFRCERQVTTDGGNTFRIKIAFEPNPTAALMLAVGRN